MTAKAICGIMTQTGVDPVNLVKQVVDYVTIFCRLKFYGVLFR